MRLGWILIPTELPAARLTWVHSSIFHQIIPPPPVGRRRRRVRIGDYAQYSAVQCSLPNTREPESASAGRWKKSNLPGRWGGP